jgi:hypothetical protein
MDFALSHTVFLELAKFASLLLSILSLDALFHTAFLEPGERLEHRLLAALERLLIAAAVCLASGWIFDAWDRRMEPRTDSRTNPRAGTVVSSFPMLLFWWGSGIMTLLFVARWLIERYYLGQFG